MSTSDIIWWHVYPLGATGAPIREEHDAAPRLRQLESWLDYLIELGCNGLLLGPIFASVNLRIEMRDQSVEALCTLLDRHDEHAERAISGMLGFLDAVCIDWVDESCPSSERDDIVTTAINALTGALAPTHK